jgi:nucleotide-binding universal stress UspA family protein
VSFKEILVAFDGSPFAKRAFSRALDIAKVHDSRITVIIIIKKEYPPIVGFSKMQPKLMKAHQKHAKKQIANLKDMTIKQDVSFGYKIKQGTSVIKEIINFAKTRRFDLIVMGSHGRTGFKKVALGSVSNGVIQHTKCPVLVTR